MPSARPADQAASLRQRAMPRLPALAVTGGKGGVGKTVVAVNLTVMLAKLGLRPLLVDCDLGLANADILLGLDPQLTLADVLAGRCPIEAARIKDPRGFSFLPAASGREELAALDDDLLQALLATLEQATAGHDLLILDTAAGIGREVLVFLEIARVVLTVATPDPTSVTDAYALIKVLEGRRPGADIRVLVNQANDEQEGVACFTRLRRVATTYLNRDLTSLGVLPRDRTVAQSVRERRPFVQTEGRASEALRACALRLKTVDWNKG